MKRLSLAVALLAAGTAYAAESAPATPAAPTSAPASAEDDSKLFYSMGFMTGKNIRSAVPEMDIERFVTGLKDGSSGKSSVISEEDMIKLLTAYRNRRAEEDKAEEQKAFQRASQDNKAKGDAYLAENAKKPGVKVTASGLQYEVLREGTGITPRETDTVEVHYEGKLVDGTVFDSSIARGQTISFPLNQVIAGWTEGLQLMKEGAKYRLVIPSDKGYGELGSGPIPPNAVLVFEVELIKVTRDKDAAKTQPVKKKAAGK